MEELREEAKMTLRQDGGVEEGDTQPKKSEMKREARFLAQ